MKNFQQFLTQNSDKISKSEAVSKVMKHLAELSDPNAPGLKEKTARFITDPESLEFHNVIYEIDAEDEKMRQAVEIDGVEYQPRSIVDNLKKLENEQDFEDSDLQNLQYLKNTGQGYKLSDKELKQFEDK